MKNIAISLLMLLSISVWNCKKDTLEGIEKIKFGYINYAWGAECVHYQLDPEHLRVYSSGCAPADSTIVYDSLLAAGKFEKARHLLQDLPVDIFSAETHRFQAQCEDCGSYYLEINKDGLLKVVTFDGKPDDSWPDYAKTSFQLLIKTIDDLK